MTETITIADDPWSIDYWIQLAELTAAMEELLYCPASFQESLYARYWVRRMDREGRTFGNREIEIATIKARKLAESIQLVYKPDLWVVDPRNFDPAKGQGAITVNIWADGKIIPWDGAHRSATLRALGKPVTANVYQRHETWREIKKEYEGKSLYSPYAHPDFAGHPIIRPGRERLDAVGQFLNHRDITMALVVGGCTGFGCQVLVSWGIQTLSLEPHNVRFQMLDSWCRYRHPKENDLRSDAIHCELADISLEESSGILGLSGKSRECVIGLSVYHHAAKDLETWRQLCKVLGRAQLHVLEIPDDYCETWHDEFRANRRHDGPKATIINELMEAGRYTEYKTLYSDHSYDGRETICLWR